MDVEEESAVKADDRWRTAPLSLVTRAHEDDDDWHEKGRWRSISKRRAMRDDVIAAVDEAALVRMRRCIIDRTITRCRDG